MHSAIIAFAIAALFSLGAPVAAQTYSEPRAVAPPPMPTKAELADLIAEGARVGLALHQAIEDCTTSSASIPTRGFDYQLGRIVVQTAWVEVLGWSGGCLAGKRDGQGVLDWRTGASQGSKTIYWTRSRQEGRMVRGSPVGLSCLTLSRSSLLSEDGALGCRLLGAGAGASHKDPLQLFRRESDGRWRVHSLTGDPVVPEARIPAGALEAASESLIAQAVAGARAPTPSVPVQSPMFDDLVQGGTIAWALERVDPRMKASRAALILSSATVGEMERFRQERQIYIDSTAKKARAIEVHRSQFIKNSDPAGLVNGFVAAFARKFASVQAADDLTVLSSGAVDYVILLDWRYRGRMNLDDKAYQAACVAAADGKCPSLFSDTISVYLIDREMRVVQAATYEAPFSVDDAPRVLQETALKAKAARLALLFDWGGRHCSRCSLAADYLSLAGAGDMAFSDMAN